MIINGDMQGTGGVEFATFRLREGVTEADLLALSRRVESEFLVQQSGLLINAGGHPHEQVRVLCEFRRKDHAVGGAGRDKAPV